MFRALIANLRTHRVRLAGPAGLDAELMGWLRTAYDRAG